MKYKIISDSACDLTSDYLKDKDIDFEIVPFLININDQEFVDDDNMTSDEVISHLKRCKDCVSACPSPLSFENACTGEYNFIVTISSHLSGSFNSACVAQKSCPNKVFAIDSKGTAGMQELIIDKLVFLIEKGVSFEKIQAEILEYRDSLSLFFTLTNYDNLVRKGRIKLFIAKLIAVAKIKSLCKAKDGEIAVDKKFLSYNQVLSYVHRKILEDKKILDKCVITYCGDNVNALKLKDILEKSHVFKQIEIRKGKGLIGFYALDNSLIVSY